MDELSKEINVWAYVRASSTDQNEGRQLIAMEKLGIPSDHIFVDRISLFNRLIYEIVPSRA